MPFWRPEPFTSMIDSDGKPSVSRSMRIGSNASCRTNASTFFMSGDLPRGGGASLNYHRSPSTDSVRGAGGEVFVHVAKDRPPRSSTAGQHGGRGARLLWAALALNEE